MRRIAFLFLLLFVNSESLSQFSKSEIAPPGISWQYKKSKNFKVYFPKELDSIANYTISFLENNINDIKVNPNDKIRRSRIILHNQNSIPNAFVTSSPRRSEFYVNAKAESPHFIHNNNWIDLLSVHEYRHLVQRELGHNNFFNKAVFYLFGEGLSSMLSRSTAPNWYWEGDAVYTETTKSNFGRGRIPRFVLTTQMNILSKNKIKYERQTLGSFKYKTPNEYETGYLMVKHLNNSYGNDVFNEIVKKANRQSFLPMPFFRALKKETGLNYNQLYFDAISSLPQKELIEKKEPINLRVNNSYSSFLYPREINSERFVALREGYGSYQDFRIIDNKGNVSLLFTPGLINDFGRIPYSNNMIAWLEFDKDPRWDKRVFSSLKILELSAKKIINKPLKGFFSSADLSPDGKRVLVAVNNLDGSQGFEEYEMKTMTKIKEKHFGGGVVSSLKYYSNSTLIGIKTLGGVKSVFLFDLNKNQLKEIYKTNKNIGWPSKVGNRLVFSVKKNDFEEIVCVNLETKEIYMVTETQLGNYYPSVNKNKIVFSSMGNNGFDIYTSSFEEMESVLDYSQNIEPILKEQNKKQNNYKTQKNNPLVDFIYPVSWGISDYGISERGLDFLTLGLESKNLFGTLMFNGGHKIDIRDKKHENYFGISYQGFFPIIDFTVSSSKDYFNQNIIINNNEGNKDTIYDADINFKIKEITSSLKVPLSFTKGKFFSSFLGSLGFSHQKFKDFYTTALTSESGRFPLISSRDTRSYVSGLLLYSRKHKKSRRQVYSPYEQTLLLELKRTTPNSDYKGSYLRSDLYLAFPGFQNLHSTRLKFRGESQADEDYLFRNNINFIYGYDNNFRFSSFLGWGLEYELPLFYPDFSIGPIAYVQRVRGMAFLNGGTVEGISNNGSNRFKETPKSLGFGITLDLNLFRQTFMFDLGVKYAYVFGVSDFEKGPSVEITLGSITF
mgnify:FL=1